jgi:hypothetical protein
MVMALRTDTSRNPVFGTINKMIFLTQSESWRVSDVAQALFELSSYQQWIWFHGKYDK